MISKTEEIKMENEVSAMNTNVIKLETNLGSFEDKTNKDFTKVWQKFKELDKEIANLPKCIGSIEKYDPKKLVICLIMCMLSLLVK